MENTHKAKRETAHPGQGRAELVGVLINAVAFLASGAAVITTLKISDREDVVAAILAVLYVAAGATVLLGILTALLRREPSSVSKLRERLVSSYKPSGVLR